MIIFTRTCRACVNEHECINQLFLSIDSPTKSNGFMIQSLDEFFYILILSVSYKPSMRINTPKNINSLTSEEIESWQNAQTSLNKIALTFEVKSTSKPPLKKFNLFNSKVDPKIHDSWTVNSLDSKFNLCLVEYRYKFSTAGPVGGYIHSDLSLYLYGHLQLKKFFGNTTIRPESLTDKVFDLYLKLDIDNPDYPKFSRNFYVTSDNKDMLIKNLPSQFYKLLETNEDVQIEFRNNSCLFRLAKSVNIQDALRLSEIGLRLDKILNDI